LKTLDIHASINSRAALKTRIPSIVDMLIKSNCKIAFFRIVNKKSENFCPSLHEAGLKALFVSMFICG
jgi:hypothetical protein